MADGPAPKMQQAARSEAAVGLAVARIAEMLVKRNVLAIVAGDYRAQDIRSALEGASPKTHVIFFPPSDALPGDSQPPTPANTGQRMAALRRARQLTKPRTGMRVACVTTAEAASELLPDPQTFDGALSKYSVGGRFDQDGPAFAAMLRRLGYFEDDRVDEPAEFAIRGKVIDIFPADAAKPVLHHTLSVDAGKTYAETCNIFYRRELILRAGGFDEGLPSALKSRSPRSRSR